MERFENQSDAELLKRTSEDPRVFECFYLRHERLVLGFLMSRTRSAELAADLAAETFAGLLEAAERFDPTRLGGTSAVPWVLSVACFAITDMLSRRESSAVEPPEALSMKATIPSYGHATHHSFGLARLPSALA